MTLFKKEDMCVQLFFSFGFFYLAFIDLLQYTEHYDKWQDTVPDLRDLTIYFNYVQCALSLKE